MSSSFNPGQPSVPTTPASVSPFEQLAYSGLFDEDDCDGSNDSRSRRPSGKTLKEILSLASFEFFVTLLDDIDDYYGKLPVHRRVVGPAAESPLRETVTSDTNVLREAIYLVQVNTYFLS